MAKTSDSAKFCTSKHSLKEVSQNSSQLQKMIDDKEETSSNICLRCGYILEESSICCFLGPGKPVYGHHRRTHVIYLFLFLCFMIISCMSYAPQINDVINTFTGLCSESIPDVVCGTLVPFMFIYRITLIMAGFDLIMLLLLCRVPSTESNRAQFHSAFWLQKLALLALLGLGAYFVPHGSFEVGWYYIGLAGSFVMLLLQLVFIIDLTYALNEFLEEKQNGLQSHACFSLNKLATLVMYCTSVLMAVFLYIVFRRPDECKMNFVLITVNVVLCVIASLVSVLSKEHNKCHLQTSAVTAYTVYLTYIASSYEDEECSSSSIFRDIEANQIASGQSLCNVVLLFALLIYACLRKNKPFYLHCENLVVFRGGENQLPHNKGTATTKEIENEEVEKQTSFSYSYSFIYFVFLLASLHVMMCLTNYYSLRFDGDDLELSTNWGALYMKTFASTLVILLYIWMLLAPVIYPDEDITNLLLLLKTLTKFIFNSLFKVLFRAWPFGTRSSSARFVYTFFFLVGTLISCIMYLPPMRVTLESNPYFCNRISKLGNCLSMDPAYLAVHRICLAMTAFFLLFTLVLFSVEYYTDPRTLIQNGLWVVKFGLFFSLVLFTFFIPLEFSRIWMYIALLGTFIFVTIQLFFLLDLTKRWNNSWASKAQATGQRRWFYMIFAVTMFLYVVSSIAIFIFYFFFTHSKHCRTNKMFTSMNLVLCVIATLVSIHPKVYECGLLQSSVATAYTTYLTWSAVSYNPNEKCNPVAAYVSQVDMRPSLSVQAIVDLILLLMLIIYFSIYAIPLTSTAKHLAKAYAKFVCRCKKSNKQHQNLAKDPTEVSPLRQAIVLETEEGELEDVGVSNRDEEKVPYSYSGYHFVFLMASMHLAMILTNWYSPKDNSHIKLTMNWATMCIKMISSSFCMLLYIWSLVVPLLLHSWEKDSI